MVTCTAWAENIQLYYIRFKTSWLKEETRHKCEDIDNAEGLDEREKKYLKGLYTRSEIGQLPEEPSQGDFDALVNAYCGKWMYSYIHVLQYMYKLLTGCLGIMAHN